jgi:hypothetical protein
VFLLDELLKISSAQYHSAVPHGWVHILAGDSANDMPTQPRNIAEAALQLQTAAAELHALSVLPEAERDESIHEAIEDIEEGVEHVEDSLKQLRSNFRSFRDKTNRRMKSVEAHYVVFGEFSTLTGYPLTDSGAAESTTAG